MVKMLPFKPTDEKLNDAYKWANTLYEENKKLKDDCKLCKSDDVQVHRIRFLYLQISRDQEIISNLQEENNELKKKLNENSMLRTLEQYEKDDRELHAKICDLNYEYARLRNETDKLRNVNCRLNEENCKLQKEVKMYKDFFSGNEVRVVLKDGKGLAENGIEYEDVIKNETKIH